MTKIPYVSAILLALAIVPASGALAAGNPILEEINKQAGGVAFSAERGQKLFSGRFAGGKPDTPSCTSCHGSSPQNMGKTRAGKEIAPMALSKTRDRYTDPKKVSKWFRRNCKSVLGRECTPLEKGDFLTFMMNQ
jgi:hypothetical protein